MTSPEIIQHGAYHRGHKFELGVEPVVSSQYIPDINMSRDGKVLAWWDSFSKGIIGIATIGASICFSVIFSSLPDPVAIRSTHDSKLSRKIHFDREAVRRFLSLSWLLFVLTLGFALISQLKLRKSTSWGGGLKALEIILIGLIIAAFMFLALGVTAYVPDVGITACAFLAAFAVVVFCMWVGAL